MIKNPGEYSFMKTSEINSATRLAYGDSSNDPCKEKKILLWLVFYFKIFDLTAI